MISIAKSQIENVTVELVVEETIGDRLGGYPTLMFGDVLIESMMVESVDTLALIKAIVSSETVDEFEEKVQDCWRNEKMVWILKSYALDCSPLFDKNSIVENSFYNSHILHKIHKEDDIVCDDEAKPIDKTKALARIYDLKRKLRFVPMPDEFRELLRDVDDE